MVIQNNPVTERLHQEWRQRIQNEFPQIDFSNSKDYLSSILYLDKVPNKFYSRNAFKAYFSFLENLKFKEPEILKQVLSDEEANLSLANKILSELNNESFNDTLYPTTQPELIEFIDKKIHYNLLKLWEVPFFLLSRIIAKYYWIQAGKRLDGLDLYNAVDQLKKAGFAFVDTYYLHGIRNGIAHGKIIFSDLDIAYIDKQGNPERLPTKKIIETFDGILDITNGFSLAFKLFCLTNSVFYERYTLPIPHSILLEELQAKANGPGWKILNCLESIALGSKRQLIIYIKNDNWDYNKVLWCSFTTALWAEELTQCFDRIFFSLKSTHSKFSTGWASYDASKFRQLRNNNEQSFEAYRDTLENNLLMFIPKLKFPKIVYKLGTYVSIFKTLGPLFWRNFITDYRPNPFIVREAQLHSRKWFIVVQHVSVVIKPRFQDNLKDLIRKNRKKIIRVAMKFSRRRYSILSRMRYLRIKFIKVFIYDSDKRLRSLLNSGLVPNLIATLEVNLTKTIQTFDIYGGTLEILGKYRIVWNKAWLEKMESHK